MKKVLNIIKTTLVWLVVLLAVGGYGTTGKMSNGGVAIINIAGVEVYRKG